MTPARGAESLMNASVLLLAVLACAAPPSGDPTPARVALTVGEVDSLRRARDFFEFAIDSTPVPTQRALRGVSPVP